MTKFEKLLEAVPDALVGMDQKGVIRFVNRETEALFDYDRDQLIGRPVETLVPEPLWQIYAQNRDSYFADPRTRSSGLEVELTGRHRDGTEFPINISMAHIDTGDVLLVITAVADVTRHQVAIRNARLLAAIVDASDDAIIGTTLDGIISSWNPAAERMYGYAAQEIIGRSGSLLAAPGRSEEMHGVLARTWSGEVVEHLEVNHQRKDGTVVPISLTVAPISDENGTVVGSSAVARDVTEQRHAFVTAQRLAAIVGGSEDAIFGSELDGTITSWNEAAERLFGYSAKEMIGKSGRRLSPRGRTSEARALLAKIGTGQHIEHLETLRIRKDGTAFPVSLTVSPIRDPEGKVVGASAILRDVTEQRRAMEATQRLAAIIESADNAIVSGSLDGTITSWNPAAERLYGYLSEEIVGRSIDLLIPEARSGETTQILAQIGAGQHVAEIETVRVRKDGTAIPVSVTVSPICDAAGTLVATSAIHRDRSAHMLKLEAAQRLAAIVESSNDAIISGTLDGTITSWNPAAERMYEYSSEEIIGKSATTLTPADRRGEIRAVLAKIRAGQSVAHLETTRLRKNGSVFPVSLTVSPVHDADGAVIGTSVIHRDLTGQKGALAEAQRFAAIVRYSGDAILTRTIDGTITSWNPAAERMFGYSGKEIVGKSIGLLIPEDRAGEMISILAKISAGTPVTNFETTRLRKDGTAVTVSLTISPHRNEAGAVVGASAIFRDVTELKQAAQYARSLIETALDPLVTISPAGKITDLNEATVKVTGVPRNKLIGTDFSRYFTDPDKAHEGYQRAFTQGAVTNYPLTLRHRDGTLTDVLYNASVYRDPGGRVLGVFAAARDVTRQK